MMLMLSDIIRSIITYIILCQVPNNVIVELFDLMYDE